MTKLKHVLMIACCTVLAACQSNETELQIPPDDLVNEIVGEEAVAQITDEVDSKDVNNILKSLFKDEHKSRSVDYNVSLIKDNEGNDRIICVNYVDNKGFALISASKSHEPIIAYSERGNFDNLENLPYPLDEYIKQAMESVAESKDLPADSLQKISRQWRAFGSQGKKLSRADYNYPDHSPYRQVITDEEYMNFFWPMLRDSVNSWQKQGYTVCAIDDYNGTIAMGGGYEISEYIKAVMHPMYIEDYWAVSLVRERTVTNPTYNGIVISTSWQQENGYNQSFPLKPSSTAHIPVGCANVAIGQIMYTYKYPASFNWSGMTLRGTANKVTSDFLYDVYKKTKSSYDVNDDASSPKKEDMANALKAYGYSCTWDDKVTNTNIVNKIKVPAIIGGRLKGIKDGVHAWVVEGSLRQETTLETEVWTYALHNSGLTKIIHDESYITASTSYRVNWGWGDGYNGNYGLQYMIPKNYTSNEYLYAVFDIHP